MYVVSVINYKGGVGKTTITANLSSELAKRGFKVLMIDLDPQSNLTFSFVMPEIWASEYAELRTIKNWFESFESKKVKHLEELIFSPERAKKILTNKGCLDMIASHLDLINIDLELAQELGGATLKQAKKNFLKVHRRLADGIQQLDSKYDIVIIDCPSNFNIVTKTAIVASTHLLIPSKPDYLSGIGIDYLIRHFETLKNDYNEYASMDCENSVQVISPQVLGIIFNMVQIYGGEPISASYSLMKQPEKLGYPIFSSYLRTNETLYPKTAQYGIPVALMTPRSNISENILNEIEKFVDEFQERLGL